MLMFARKMISAYGATSAIALFMACSMSDGYATGYGLLALIGVMALAATPVVFLYGTIMSALLELATRRIPVRSVGILVSGLGHAGLGALFASIIGLGSLFFYASFASTAVVYFLIDLLQQLTENGRYRGKVLSVLLAAPIVAAGIFTIVTSKWEGL